MSCSTATLMIRADNIPISLFCCSAHVLPPNASHFHPFISRTLHCPYPHLPPCPGLCPSPLTRIHYPYLLPFLLTALYSYILCFVNIICPDVYAQYISALPTALSCVVITHLYPFLSLLFIPTHCSVLGYHLLMMFFFYCCRLPCPGACAGGQCCCLPGRSYGAWPG